MEPQNHSKEHARKHGWARHDPANDMDHQPRESVQDRQTVNSGGQQSQHSRLGGEINLEDRLRNLIISNAVPQSTGQPFAPSSEKDKGPILPLSSPAILPPHMQSASQVDRQNYIQHHSNQIPSGRSGDRAGLIDGTSSGQPKRRPNQAQRRQMSAQLSVPTELHSRLTQVRQPHGSQHPAPRQNASSHHQGPPNGYGRQPRPPSTNAFIHQPHHDSQGTQQRGARVGPQRGGFNGRGAFTDRPQFQTGLPQGHFQNVSGEHFNRQIQYLEALAKVEVDAAAIDEQDLIRHFSFRASLEEACRNVIQEHEEARLGTGKFDRATVALKCFGSLSSGYATKDSDMDVALLSPKSDPPPCSSESHIPRIIEKMLIDKGYGARLLTKTRVPIIKLCERPTPALMEGLKAERLKWEKSSEEGSRESPLSTSHDPNSKEAKEKSREEADVAETLRRFTQQGSENLYLYYRRAKRLFEKIGGTDINSPQHQEQSPDKLQLLNSASRAFVDGLSDHVLRGRLLNYKSLNLGSNIRSLAGVWYQAEGEWIVMSWEARPVEESTVAKERQGEAVVKEWRQLQDKITPDVLNFNKSLQRSWDRLKVLSSAKLGILRERHDESPGMYYVRCVGILQELDCRDLTPNLSPPPTPHEIQVLTVLRRSFVDGILDKQIAGRVRGFIDLQPQLSLGAVFAQYDAEVQITSIHGKATNPADQTIVDRYADAVRSLGTSAVESSIVAPFRELMSRYGTLPDPAKAQSSSGRINQQDNPTAFRDRHVDPLGFPKSGVGIQCDINFSNYLALHNTLLLRCYHHCDPRVRPIVLFVKAWAKRRMINSPYRGTLSSYGYVLMVLHFLVNVAEPPVLPNLQLAWKPKPNPGGSSDPVYMSDVEVDKYDVRFWRDEVEIQSLAAKGVLTQNRQMIGTLLRGFFHYFAHQGHGVIGAGFSWQMDVLSIRNKGGLLSKRQKGWTGAKTTFMAPTQPGQEKKEVRHRYLFAIEDPFEIDHNIARTVTHPGIVGIRDEFRRAWRIITAVGQGNTNAEEDFFAQAVDPAELAQKALEEVRASKTSQRSELPSGERAAANAQGISSDVA